MYQHIYICIASALARLSFAFCGTRLAALKTISVATWDWLFSCVTSLGVAFLYCNPS